MKTQEYKLIEISLIDDPERAMRSDLTEEGLKDLAESIRENGVIEPIVVRPRGNRYEVIAGHRRLAASWLAHRATIPCIIRDADDKETTILRVHENLIREDVNPVDEAKFIARTIRELGIGVDEFARMIHRSESYVMDRLAIDEMPEYMKEALSQGTLKLGAALALAQIEDEDTRYRWTLAAIRDGMSVRAAEDALRQWRQYAALPVAQREQNPLPDSPLELPPQMVQCARCGENDPLGAMMNVPIHRRGYGCAKEG
jgi:ParB family chromosome partitioning protein